MKVWVTAVALALSSCSSGSDVAEQAEVADVNAKNALARIATLEGRVEALDQRLSAELRTRSAVDHSLANSVDSLAEKHNRVVDRVYRGR